jgi:hypothetical protein
MERAGALIHNVLHQEDYLSAAKSVDSRIPRHRQIVGIVIAVILVILFLLGFYLGPDKMMRPPPGQTQTEGRPD